MKKGIDEKLYEEYLKGNKEAFEELYSRYKNRLRYFVNNIVKDYEKAEDLTQETFIYVMENKMKEEVSFKYYIYLVAKSKAFNYINVEKRRKEITAQYFVRDEIILEQDIIDAISKEEDNKKILNAINSLEEKYKNAIYLVYIEKLSYDETAKIIGQTLTNTKSIIHRGKRKLRNILLQEGINSMNKVTKVIVLALLIVLFATGVVFAGVSIYKLFNTNHNTTMNPTYKSTISDNTINNLWVGSLDLAWSELKHILAKDKIEFEDNIDIANKLNESDFKKDSLDKEDYIVNVTRTMTNGYKIEATLNKTLSFLESFDNLTGEENRTFGKGTENIKWFGINNASSEKKNKNIQVLFYDKDEINREFALKLNTKEGDEIILYKTNANKSFDEYYNDIENKSKEYKGSQTFGKDDELLVPYVRVNGMISYDEFYGKTIKDTNGLVMYDVIQTVNFYLNEKGCNLTSGLSMTTEYLSAGNRYFYYTDTFVIFMKESSSNKPYFVLKVDNDDILEKKQETNEPKIVDFTIVKDATLDNIEAGEYKFYEDENYEYYYPNKKTKYVMTFFKTGEMMTVEDALKHNKITLKLLDDYGVKYSKKIRNN